MLALYNDLKASSRATTRAGTVMHQHQQQRRGKFASSVINFVILRLQLNWKF